MIEIKEGVVSVPVKAVIYGAEGIGKSTLASQMPNAVFFDLEGGTNRLNCKRISQRFDSFDEFLKALADVAGMDFQTVVIDTVDALELLIVKSVCKKYGKDGIESFGYGKGYTYVGEEMKRFLEACDAVIAMGKNVTLLAHAKITKFEQPDEMGAYDRWSMKLTKMSAPLVKEWADLLLFCNYKTTVVSTSDNKKKVMGGERVMYSTHHSCWDAKNRFSLKDELPLSYESISDLYKAEHKKPDMLDTPSFGIASDPQDLPFDIGEVPAEDVESVELRGLRALMAQDNITEEQILKAFKGKYSAIENIEADVIQNQLLNKWAAFIKYVGGQKK